MAARWMDLAVQPSPHVSFALLSVFLLQPFFKLPRHRHSVEHPLGQRTGSGSGRPHLESERRRDLKLRKKPTIVSMMATRTTPALEG